MSTVNPLEHTNIKRYLPIIKKYSKLYNVPEKIIGSIIYSESRGNPDAWNGSNNENSRGLIIYNATIIKGLSMDIKVRGER